MRTAEQHVLAWRRRPDPQTQKTWAPNHIKDSPRYNEVFAMRTRIDAMEQSSSVFIWPMRVAPDFAGDARRTMHAYSKDLN